MGNSEIIESSKWVDTDGDNWYRTTENEVVRFDAGGEILIRMRADGLYRWPDGEGWDRASKCSQWAQGKPDNHFARRVWGHFFGPNAAPIKRPLPKTWTYGDVTFSIDPTNTNYLVTDKSARVAGYGSTYRLHLAIWRYLYGEPGPFSVFSDERTFVDDNGTWTDGYPAGGVIWHSTDEPSWELYRRAYDGIEIHRDNQWRSDIEGIECARAALDHFWPIEKPTAPPADEGRKDDSEKNRVDLLPFDALEEVAQILTYGARKYADRNWEKGMAWSRPFGALLRHVWAWWRGEKADPETGRSHLAHAACCVLFLLTYELRQVGTDDRPSVRRQRT